MVRQVTATLRPGGLVRHSVAEPVLPLERRRLQCYLALMLGDIGALFAGFLIAGFAHPGSVAPDQPAILAQLILPVFLTIALYNGAYSRNTLQSARRGALLGSAALAVAAAVVVFVTSSTRSGSQFGWFLLVTGIVFSALSLALIRAAMSRFVAWRCGPTVVNELVIADGGPLIDLPGVRRADAAALGLQPSLDDPLALHRIGQVIVGVDRVVVSCPAERRQAWATILRGANIEGEVVDPSVAQLGAHGARIAGGHGLLRISIGPLGLRARGIKRVFDLAIAGSALALLSPLLLLVTIAILLEDGRPVLFIQRRVGRANRFFNLIKFRSMCHIESDCEGFASARRDDQRTTRIGKLIRRTSIDELPQLINVLKGEMSIVGPRPHALGSHAGARRFWEVDQRYWTRHALKPGLTGLAQVRGLRGATDREADLTRRLNADLEYLHGWSLWRDVKIVVATLRVVIHHKAY